MIKRIGLLGAAFVALLLTPIASRAEHHWRGHVGVQVYVGPRYHHYHHHYYRGGYYDRWGYWHPYY
jgi:sterol desaturase/sphingolipid hydroxylase (fatty acid hydroxylase superfamily)